MATGRAMKLTGQVGEFLVCAELGRRDILATPFAGNVPEFDVIAAGPGHQTVPVQVKTSKSKSWQTRLDIWLDVTYDPRKKRHIMKGKRRLRNLDLIYVYVALSEPKGDRFFIVTQWRVREIIWKDYLRRMESRGFKRPHRPESMHWAVHLRDLEPYEDDWQLIIDRCSGRRGRRR